MNNELITLLFFLSFFTLISTVFSFSSLFKIVDIEDRLKEIESKINKREVEKLWKQ